MSFHFTLDTLLRYRRNQKDQEQRVLRAIHSNLAALRQRLEQVRRERLATRSLLNAQLQGGSDGERLRENQSSEELLDHSERALLEQIDKFERARQLQQQRFEQCWRNCQILENLRERQFTEWRSEQERREQQRLDELAILRFRRDMAS